MRRRKRIHIGNGAAAILLTVGVLLLTVLSLGRLDEGRRAESQAQLERSLRRAAVACYTAEGIYPPSLAYLQEHYGVQINEAQFHVDYSVFADNIMPDIVVLDRRNA